MSTAWNIAIIVIAFIILGSNLGKIEERYDKKQYRLMLFPALWIAVALFILAGRF